jgi:thiol-disulfide isomerase/thioredoxin
MTTILDELEKIGPVEDQKTGLVTNLKNHGFKYLGLYFTATWCSYCVKIVDKLPKIIEKVNHRGPDLKLLTIRLDDERSNFAYNYLKFKSITYEEC